MFGGLDSLDMPGGRSAGYGNRTMREAQRAGGYETPLPALPPAAARLKNTVRSAELHPRSIDLAHGRRGGAVPSRCAEFHRPAPLSRASGVIVAGTSVQPCPGVKHPTPTCVKHPVRESCRHATGQNRFRHLSEYDHFNNDLAARIQRTKSLRRSMN